MQQNVHGLVRQRFNTKRVWMEQRECAVQLINWDKEMNQSVERWPMEYSDCRRSVTTPRNISTYHFLHLSLSAEAFHNHPPASVTTTVRPYKQRKRQHMSNKKTLPAHCLLGET